MVYELIGSGELPVVRIGKSVRVPVAELEQWIRDQAAVQHMGMHQH